jgi:hypothetical protein
MYLSGSAVPDNWLAFEVGAVRKLDFRSVAIPFSGEPGLGVYLKRLGARVAANDLAQWATTVARASIENNAVRLTDEDIDIVVENAYVPRESYFNPALSEWFNEIDAFWFDNVRDNIEKLSSPIARSIALSAGIMVGDYVLSFDDETRSLRHPLALSNLFKQIVSELPAPVNNGQRNTSVNREAKDFIAEQHTDLLFLRLPRPRNRTSERNRLTRWREEWVRGADDFWDDFELSRNGRLGDYVETRQQYLRLVEEFLTVSMHIEHWAISFVEDGFISTTELVECVGRVRQVDSVYTKDFSELTGAKASIITA